MLYILMLYKLLWHFQGAQILSFVYDLISRALPHKMEPLEFHLIGFEDQNIFVYWSLLLFLPCY